MFILTSAKGGCGVSVCAAAIALAHDAVLVDLAGDQPAILGIDASDRPTLDDWVTSPAPRTLPDPDPCRLIPMGDHQPANNNVAAWQQRADALSALGHRVVIDAGTAPIPAPLQAAESTTVAVMRPCYLALRRWYREGRTCDGVIVVGEPGRALSVDDVVRCIGAPLLAHVPWDPTIARAVDAGLLATRPPRALATLHTLVISQP